MMDAYPVVHIVDDDDAVRDSLEVLLRVQGYRTRAFAAGESFLAHIGPEDRGCVLLDLRMPGMQGADVLAALRERGIALPVIVLTAHGDAASARDALKTGAFDFLEKPVDHRTLLATIEAAHHSDHASRAAQRRRADLASRFARLTRREREVLEHVVAGRQNREIGALLGISPRTVEVYKARILDKLQVSRLPEAMRLALEAGIGGAEPTA
ncbi:MAG TPA: response regulator [Casimicrobiaceae bacterium]|jgi:RNA polymerase sigma factor (sigma-70 family)